MAKLANKIKGSKLGKWFTASAVAAFCVVGSALTCFAAEGDTSTDMTTTLTTAFNGMQSDIFTYIGIVLPIALAIVGAIFGIKYAINFFRSTARKS